MNRLALALGLLLPAAAAEYTTSLLLPGLDLDPQAIGGYVGSVIATDATATTYAMGCPTFVGNACGVPTSLTVTQGPSTVHCAFSTGGGDMTASCALTAAHGVCSGSILATGAQNGVVTVEYKSFGMYDGVEVTITAGGGPDATAATATAATATGPAAAAAAGETSVSSSSGSGVAGGEGESSSTGGSGSSVGAGSSSATNTAGSSSSVSAKASTGGVPMITGHAQWVIGGAGAAVAIAAM